MLEYLSQTGTPFIIVGTKCDKLNSTERKTFVDFLHENLPEIPYILYSSKNNEGRDDLWKTIYKSLG